MQRAALLLMHDGLLDDRNRKRGRKTFSDEQSKDTLVGGCGTLKGRRIRLVQILVLQVCITTSEFGTVQELIINRRCF